MAAACSRTSWSTWSARCGRAVCIVQGLTGYLCKRQGIMFLVVLPAAQADTCSLRVRHQPGAIMHVQCKVHHAQRFAPSSLCVAEAGPRTVRCHLLQGFDPNVGLFASTSDNRLYPNPEAPALVPEAMQLFEFMGRMLGKVRLCIGLQHAT
jgi:hypothetical protein